MATLTKCPLCGGNKLRPCKRVSRRVFGETTLEAIVHGRQCVRCKEATYHGRDIERADRAMALALLDARICGGGVMRFIRKVFGASELEWSQLLGVPLLNIELWEAGALGTGLCTWAAIRQLVIERSLPPKQQQAMAFLYGVRKVRKAPKVIKVKVPT